MKEKGHLASKRNFARRNETLGPRGQADDTNKIEKNQNKTASRGVGVLLYDIDSTVKEISSDDFGRILSCELKYENKTYIITNVYCPNDSGVRKTFIRDIDPYVTDGRESY